MTKDGEKRSAPSALRELGDSARRSPGGRSRHGIKGSPLWALLVIVAAAAAMAIVIPRTVHGGASGATAAENPLGTLAQPCGTGLQIQMFSAGSGWIYSAYRPDPVWHTTTGGVTWEAAGPPAAKGNTAVAACFVSAEEGWVVTAPARFGPLQVWETADGGQRWKPLSQVAIPRTWFSATSNQGLAWRPVSLPVLDFASRSSGWLWLTGGPAAGGILLGTENGGRSWIRLPNPPAGTQSELWLVTPSLGFDLTGKHGSSLGLWATHDGGRDWSQVSGLQCGEGRTCMVVVGRPAFANASDGSLLAVAEPNIDRLLTYATRDGGQRWSRVGTPLLLKTPFPTPVDQVTRSLAVLVAATALHDGTSLFALLRSADGGRHWTSTASSGLGQGVPLSNVSFATPSVGWVWMPGAEVPGTRTGSSGPALFETKDGGSVWHRLRGPRGLTCTALPTPPPTGQSC